MAHWSDDFIGRAYSATYDCVHLLVDIQQTVFRRDVDIPVEREANIFRLCQQISQYKLHYLSPIPIEESVDGDAVLMKTFAGRLNHIGVLAVIGDARYVVHNLKSTGSVVCHRERDLEKFGLFIEGYYRPIEATNKCLNMDTRSNTETIS